MTKVIRHKKDFNSLFAVLDIIVTICSFFLAYFIVNLINTHYFNLQGNISSCCCLLFLPGQYCCIHQT